MLLVSPRAANAANARVHPPPNVLVILADDLGYGDLGSYGGTTLRTPALDALAASGARFTDFYVTAPRCTPSRASLLTGRYPQRTSVTGLIWPEDTYGLPRTETTIADLLKRNGYVTALIGKWHLGHARPEFLPPAHGFDYWFGMAYPTDMDADHPRSIANKLNWPPLALQRGDEIVERPVDLDHLTDKYTRECVNYIRANAQRPWFLFYASHAPHTYLAASERFRGKSKGGLFGDMVEEFDDSVGRIVEALRATGQLDRTVIIFTNDNGATVHSEADHERGRTNPLYRRYYADGSGGSNAPLRGGKNTAYEGGSRVPAIVSWPGKIPAGAVLRDVASINDIVPTIAAMTGTALPAGVRLDGVDLTPTLSRKSPRRTAAIFYDCPKVRGVRVGRWKLVIPSAQWETKEKPAELYDLEADIGETRNLADAHPELVKELKTRIGEFEAEVSPAAAPR